MNKFIDLLQIQLQIPPAEVMKLLENRTELAELGPDARLFVLDSLNLSTILSFPLFDDHYDRIAQEVFRRKYSRKTFKIADVVLIGFEEIPDVNNVIYLKQFGEILRVLKIFGHLMTKLKLEYSQHPQFGGVNISPIVKYINLYCADSLVELEVIISSDYVEFFDKMTKPFKNVKKLTISGQFNRLTGSTHTFTEMFPSVRSLSLYYVQVFDKNGLDMKFPHLIHLSVQVAQSDKTRFEDSDVEKLLRTNPYIRSLKLDRCDPNLLKIVNEVLHNLETLQLTSFIGFRVFNENKPIVFKNVKYLLVDGDSSYIQDNVEFTNLTEFHLIGFAATNAHVVDFLAQNPHLKSVSVKKSHISETELKKLIEMNLNLDEITLLLSCDMNDETVLNFVRKYENMKKITFTSQYSLKTIAEATRKEFRNKWAVILHSSNLESKVTLENNEHH